MVMTILEAHVPLEKWTDLEAAYKAGTKHLDEGIVQTFLVRNLRELTICRIITVWESREALEKMRASGETPRGVLMFREVGAEPALSVFEVAAQAAV
jgi:hypothetical protein